MAIVLCSKCNGVDGVLCRHCGKPNHFNLRSKKNGGRRWGGAGRYDHCWRALARAKERFKQCEGHEPPLGQCDVCGIRALAVLPAHDDWYRYARDPNGWNRLKGLTGEKEMLLCPSCQVTFRVGLDWSLERGGEPLLCESIACAFAFQLGQVAWPLLPELLFQMSPQYVPR